MRAPVSVCIIVKNEPLLEQCLQNLRDYVEELVVVDTGSTDGTFEIAKKYADICEVYTKCNDPESGLINDFSDARRRSFELATKKWILWVDADDILEGLEHLPKLISEYENSKTDLDAIGYLFKYEYAYDPNGKCVMEHFRERLISDKTKFHWLNPVHEVLVPNAGQKIALVQRGEIVYKHRRHLSKKAPEAGRNLRILKKYFDNLPNLDAADARQLYYYGLELSNAMMFDEAIKYLSKYVDVSGWDDERVMACLKLVEIYQRLSKYRDAIPWAFKAIELKGEWSEGYFALAKMFYFLAEAGEDPSKNYDKCIHFINLGLKMPETQTLLFKNPMEKNVDIHRFLNMALNKVGKVKEALDSVNKGLEFEPGDPALNNNKKLYEIFLSKNNILHDIDILVKNQYLPISALEKAQNLIENKNITLDSTLSTSNAIGIGNKVWEIPDNYNVDSIPLDLSKQQIESSFIMLWHQYMLTNEFDKAIEFLNSVPQDLQTSEAITKAKQLTETLKKNPINENKLNIVFFAGDGLEIWTPETVKKTGIGGSELMLLEMAKRLAAQGHRVRVYNSCGSLEGKYDGVEYNQTGKFKDLVCDVLVISRRADMLDDKYNIQAKLKLLWVHDVFALGANNHLLLKADRILALSEWHKENLIKVHNVHPDQIIVTRNAINLERFNKNVIRNKFRCINSSSPDRSWPALLNMWPEIKKQVPQAELHLYYGFHNWKIAAQNNPEHQQLIKQIENQIIAMKDLDVVFHDRVSQEQLAEDMLASSLWLYPTWFSETSCITAMEVQAAGLKMITSNIAALKETAGSRATLLDGDWMSEEYHKSFIENTVKELRNYKEEERLALQTYAKENFSFDTLSVTWDEMFHSLLKKIKNEPIVPYQPSKQYLKAS